MEAALLCWNAYGDDIEAVHQPSGGGLRSSQAVAPAERSSMRPEQVVDTVKSISAGLLTPRATTSATGQPSLLCDMSWP
jgi:hypothetical protein